MTAVACARVNRIDRGAKDADIGHYRPPMEAAAQHHSQREETPNQDQNAGREQVS